MCIMCSAGLIGGGEAVGLFWDHSACIILPTDGNITLRTDGNITLWIYDGADDHAPSLECLI